MSKEKLVPGPLSLRSNMECTETHNDIIRTTRSEVSILISPGAVGKHMASCLLIAAKNRGQRAK